MCDVHRAISIVVVYLSEMYLTENRLGGLIPRWFFLYVNNNTCEEKSYIYKLILFIYRVNNMLSCISHDDFYTYTTQWFT